MYLVVHTVVKRIDIDGSYQEHRYMHFIDLRKQEVLSDIESFVHHLNYFKGQEVERVEYSTTRLGNW